MVLHCERRAGLKSAGGSENRWGAAWGWREGPIRDGHSLIPSSAL